jgi:hypothetical protein
MMAIIHKIIFFKNRVLNYELVHWFCESKNVLHKDPHLGESVVELLQNVIGNRAKFRVDKYMFIC